MLQSRPISLNRLRDELCHDRAALDPKAPIVPELACGSDISNDESAKPLISDEYIGAESENEILNAELSGGCHRARKIVGACRFVEEISGTADAERGVLTEGLVYAKPRSLKPPGKTGVQFTLFRI